MMIYGVKGEKSGKLMVVIQLKTQLINNLFHRINCPLPLHKQQLNGTIRNRGL